MIEIVISYMQRQLTLDKQIRQIDTNIDRQIAIQPMRYDLDSVINKQIDSYYRDTYIATQIYCSIAKYVFFFIVR